MSTSLNSNCWTIKWLTVSCIMSKRHRKRRILQKSLILKPRIWPIRSSKPHNTLKKAIEKRTLHRANIHQQYLHSRLRCLLSRTMETKRNPKSRMSTIRNFRRSMQKSSSVPKTTTWRNTSGSWGEWKRESRLRRVSRGKRSRHRRRTSFWQIANSRRICCKDLRELWTNTTLMIWSSYKIGFWWWPRITTQWRRIR